MSSIRSLTGTAIAAGVLALSINITPSFSEGTNMLPPYVAAPADAKPVMVKVELEAKDPAAFKQYLMSKPVIPVTRLASGIKYSWSTQDANAPAKFTLLQEWTSVKQHQDYIKWRVDTGALKELTDQLSKDPVVTYLDPFDMNTLPAQVPSN
jgi:hypothetical protein